MQQLIIIRGLPGSGKSTLAKQLAKLFDCQYVEADMYFIDKSTGAYEFDTTKLGAAHKWCREYTRHELSMGSSCIVSNTFTTTAEMSDYVELAAKYRLQFPQIIVCQANYGSIHNVPAETLQRMKDRFNYDITPLVTRYMNYRLNE